MACAHCDKTSKRAKLTVEVLEKTRELIQLCETERDNVAVAKWVIVYQTIISAGKVGA